jgi:CBS domain-containing protein
MSHPVIACDAKATIRLVADRMLDGGIHALPVVDEIGKLLGIITVTDLLKILRDYAGDELDEPLPFVYEQPSPLAPMFE